MTVHLTDRAAMTAVKSSVMQTLLDCIDIGVLGTATETEARAQIRGVLGEILRAGGVSPADAVTLTRDICDEMFGLGPLEPLMAREDVTDIMVSGCNPVFIEAGNRLIETAIRFDTPAQLMGVCQRAVGRAGRRVDEASPFCDARLPDGSRVHAVVPPLAVDGPALTIRKFRRDPLTMDALFDLGTLTAADRTLLRLLARHRCNILVTGGSGSGKTTLLNCLAAEATAHERIITCEDAAELRLHHGHVVRLETREPNTDGHGGVTMMTLVRNALRMRPDRIIVGEVRGGEALDLIQAMGTGHDGSMGTLHANSPAQALARLEALTLMGAPHLSHRTVGKLIRGGVDIIVHLQRGAGGHRRLTRISEVTPETESGVRDLIADGVVTRSPSRGLEAKMQSHGLSTSVAAVIGGATT